MMVTMDEANLVQKSGDIDLDRKFVLVLELVNVVGNMGSDQRFDYIVLVDTKIYLRLEGQTKAYGVTTIISSNTFSRLKIILILLNLIKSS